MSFKFMSEFVIINGRRNLITYSVRALIIIGHDEKITIAKFPSLHLLPPLYSPPTPP